MNHGETTTNITIQEIYSKFEENRKLFPSFFTTTQQQEVLDRIFGGIQRIDDDSTWNIMRKQFKEIMINKKEVCEAGTHEEELLVETISQISNIEAFGTRNTRYCQMLNELRESMKLFEKSIITRRKDDNNYRRYV